MNLEPPSSKMQSIATACEKDSETLSGTIPTSMSKISKKVEYTHDQNLSMHAKILRKRRATPRHDSMFDYGNGGDDEDYEEDKRKRCHKKKTMRVNGKTKHVKISSDDD